MSRTTLTIRDGKLEYSHEADERLTPEQRYYLLMALIIASAACTFFISLFALA